MTTVNDYDAVDQAVAQVTPIIENVAKDLWRIAELSLFETQSAQLMIDVLEEQGFAITNAQAAGIPTAFIAEWGSGQPIIGFLTEYDALPGLGNEAVPYQKPRADGGTSGHGCGHNLLGAGTLGAALALKDLMAANNTPGTIRVYGCAAEETEGAKLYMAREGMFDDLDAALHWHPGTDAQVTNFRSTATTSLTIEFAGRTAHAGAAPWLGRSAVHAAELFAHGVNLMREHIEPTARIHYVYESGGLAPNIVPDYARIRMFVRDTDRAHVDASVAWVQQIAEGAALATQTKATVDIYNGMYDLMPNKPLAEQLQAHMERIGIPSYSDEERSFAEELQRNAGVATDGFTTATKPLPDDTYMMGASTDVGDVSWLTPTMGCGMPTMPLHINLHTWAATASHGTEIGLKGAIYAARALAALGADLMANKELRDAARADFERRTAGRPYESALPKGQQLPRGLTS